MLTRVSGTNNPRDKSRNKIHVCTPYLVDKCSPKTQLHNSDDKQFSVKKKKKKKKMYYNLYLDVKGNFKNMSGKWRVTL